MGIGTHTLAILGTGRMGEALLSGLLASEVVPGGRVICTDSRPDRLDELAKTHGVNVTDDNAVAIHDADVVVLGLKPQVLPAVLREHAGAFRPDHTVISLAAGITTAAIEALLPGDIAVVRIMTNTPARVHAAMSVVAPGRHATDEHCRTAEQLLASVGRVRRLDESQLDSVTAVSGSGPAYLFLVAEAMIDAAVASGLDRDLATELVLQTITGSARMLSEGGGTPTELREMVTSPAGTTAAALRVLEAAGLRAAIADAVEAAARRSRELADG